MSLKDDLKAAFIAAEFEDDDFNIEHDSDTGPGDESYCELWKVAGTQFYDEDKAKFIKKLLNAYREGKLTIKR